jgi:hypothetical protein
MSFLAWIFYCVVTIFILAFPIRFLLEQITTTKNNLASEIIRIIWYIGLSVFFWVSPDNRGTFILAFLVGIIALDLQETILTTILGASKTFKNQGTSLRERRVALWLNVFFVGKIVTSVSFSNVTGMPSGLPIYVTIDFSDGQRGDGRYVSNKLPAFITALIIRSNVRL